MCEPQANTGGWFRTGAVVMKDETRKIIISAYQKRKMDEIEHPYLLMHVSGHVNGALPEGRH